eukprot:4541788-Amphidinium_carterae.2
MIADQAIYAERATGMSTVMAADIAMGSAESLSVVWEALAMGEDHFWREHSERALLRLGKELVLKARAEELNDYKNMGVCKEVEDAEAWEVSGKAPRGFVRPPHLKGTGRCWETLKAVYGTLTAAADYRHEFNNTLLEGDMVQGGAYPNCFFHEQHQVRLTYHGDDIVLLGGEQGLDVVEPVIGRRFQVVRKARLGRDRGDQTEATLLNRLLRVTAEGILIEPDPRHAWLIVVALRLLGAKGVSTPGLKLSKEEYEAGARLTGEQTTVFRALVARARYLSEDRADLAFCANSCCRGRAAPTVAHLALAKRMGRYLLHRPRV